MASSATRSFILVAELLSQTETGFPPPTPSSVKESLWLVINKPIYFGIFLQDEEGQLKILHIIQNLFYRGRADIKRQRML